MKVDEGLIRDIFRLFVWFPLRWSVGVVPVRWAFYIFKLMGDAHYLGGGRKKRVISENLKNLLGLENGDAPGIVKGNFENHYTDRLHIFLYPRLRTRDSIERFLTFEKKDVLVSYFIKWRIEDLKQFYTSTGGDINTANNLLEQRISSALRDQFGGRC